MPPKRILFALAHPDDESFGSGALIAKYVAEGAEVFYICATDGSRGTVAPRFIEQYGSVEAVRAAELECAAQTLGFKAVYNLGYRDSGMMGSLENDDPACLWQADEDEVTRRIVEIIREIQPQVIITFDPYGGYGHPDHIFIHRATTRAFHAAADPVQFADAGAPYAPQKLYYTAFPRKLLHFYIFMTRLRGENPRAIGENKDLDLVAILDHTLPATAKIDVLAHLDTGDAASACHASQISPRNELPKWLRRITSGKQGLTRIHPAPNGKKERDLFEGLKL